MGEGAWAAVNVGLGVCLLLLVVVVVACCRYDVCGVRLLVGDESSSSSCLVVPLALGTIILDATR